MPQALLDLPAAPPISPRTPGSPSNTPTLGSMSIRRVPADVEVQVVVFAIDCEPLEGGAGPGMQGGEPRVGQLWR